MASVHPHDVIVPVGARCSHLDLKTLRIVYRREATSCAPRGPCSRQIGADLPARQLRLHLAGCDAPLPGRFVSSGKRCGKNRVLRFNGKLPKGQPLHFVRVSKDKVRQGGFTVAGKANPTGEPPTSMHP